jgi:hypothetical protein
VAGGAEGVVVFGAGEAAAELRKFGRLMGEVAGAVLVHEIEVGVGRELGEPVDGGFGAGEAAGEDEVADEEAALGDAVGVELEVADLAVHLVYGLLVDGGIVGDAGELAADVGVGVFDIGHIDIDHAIEEGEGLEGVVATGVVDEGEVEAGAGGDEEGSEDLGDDMGGADEVDVVATGLLELEHDGGELLGGGWFAAADLADVIVLAVEALQVAAGEKDGAGAAVAAEGVFFTKVGAVAGDDGQLAGATGAQLVAVETIDAAVTRADIARTEASIGPLNSLSQFSRREALDVSCFDRILHATWKEAPAVRPCAHPDLLYHTIGRPG